MTANGSGRLESSSLAKSVAATTRKRLSVVGCTSIDRFNEVKRDY